MTNLYSTSIYDTCLVKKDRAREGFEVFPDTYIPELEDEASKLKHAKYFTDSRKKFLIDNSAPFGHFITDWLYLLLTEIEKLALPPEEILILIHQSPDTHALHINHMSTITQYVYDRFTKKGYNVDYVDSEYFYISNYHHFPSPFYVPEVMVPSVVGRFLEEGITTTSYGRKIYISRSKTTTSNGNYGVHVESRLDHSLSFKDAVNKVRQENMYKFSNRIDDEEKLEAYLKSLGFKILVPEDFDSYADQLNAISEARILCSITSSALFSLMVLRPGARVVEVCTPAPTIINTEGAFLPESEIFTDHFRSVALAKGHVYTAIPNRSREVDKVIQYIESTPELKLLLSS